MIDDADRAEVWRERQRAARKEHACNECGRRIAPGELYRYISMVYDGTARSYKICAHCGVCCDWLSENCSGYLVGAVEDDLREHVEEYASTDLARLAVGMRRQWQRFKRPALLPIPKLPRSIELGDHR